MAVRKEIQLALSGKDEGASSLIERTAGRLRMLQREQRASGEALLERSLKGGAGVERLADLGANALGVAGFGLAAVAIDRVAQSVTHVVKGLEEVRQGKKTFAEITDEAIASIPVVGAVYELTRAFMDLWDGRAAAEQREINRLMNEQKNHLEWIRRNREMNLALIKLEREELERLARHGDAEAGAALDTQARAERDKDFERQRNKVRDDVRGGLMTPEAAMARIGRIDKAEKDATDADVRDRNEVFNRGEAAMAAAKERGDEQDRRQRQAREDAESEGLQKSLTLNGQYLDAKLEQIRLHYDRATEAGQTAEEIDQIQKNRALAEEEARRQDALDRQVRDNDRAHDLINSKARVLNERISSLQEGGSGPTRGSELSTRFHGTAENRRDLQADMLEVLRAQLKSLENQGKALEEANRLMQQAAHDNGGYTLRG